MIERVPPRFASALPDSLDPSLLAKVKEWIPTKETLLLSGPTGSGKSWAASVAARLWARDRHEAFIKAREEYERGDGRFSAWEESSFLWCDVPDLAGKLRNIEASDDVVASCQSAPLLVLDDLGSDKGSDYLTERIYAIVNHRYAWERPTIVTTNLDLEQMGFLWPRMASRLCSGVIVGLSGADRRLGAHAS